MALVKCPKCGKENVSDTAESCPECGYGIKAHYTKIRLEEMRVINVPPLKKPQLVVPIVVSVISFLIILFGDNYSNSEKNGSGDPKFQGGFLE